MWAEELIEKKEQLLFSALALGEWSLHLWPGAGRTCRFFCLWRSLQFEAKTRRGKQRTYRKPCLTLLLLLSPDSLLLCSFSSALLLQGAGQRHWNIIVALPASTVTPHYQELCFTEWKPLSFLLGHAEGSLVQFSDIKQGVKRGDRWGRSHLMMTWAVTSVHESTAFCQSLTAVSASHLQMISQSSTEK